MIPEERLARGEISVEEYGERRETLVRTQTPRSARRSTSGTRSPI